ncbi:MAG: PAS domain S-box protein [Candidatus Melainabacteria bacterium]|nr:PAS domain S-box protein [Candidatus Melainabacteria bacterium]
MRHSTDWLAGFRSVLKFHARDAQVHQESIETRYLIELADLRQRERALIERAVDVVCTIDSTGAFVFVSPSCKNAWGYDVQEIQGQSSQVVVGDKGFKNILRYAQEADQSIEKVTFETTIRCKDGTIKHAAWRGQWSISEKTLFCIVHDMTEQKQVETALRASEKQLKAILETLPAGVLIMDDCGKVEFANASSRQLLMMEETAIKGQSTESLFITVFPLYQSRLSDKDRLLRRNGGAPVPVEVHTDSLELGGQNKQILLFVDKSSYYDLERTKQDFFAMVAHDFRAPLTSLRNLVVLIEEGVLEKESEEGTKISEQVSLECAQLLRLVQDMVDIGKLGTNTFALDCEQKPISPIVQCAVEGIKFVAEKKSVKISLPETAASCCVDDLRLNQVLTNLLTNAIKHSQPNSHVQVEISEASDECVRFAVNDSGPGIPADKVERVFEAYQQLPGANGKPTAGTGLGLAICKKIVHHHGGEIGVESTPGEGSSFWFTIPKQPAQNRCAN